MQHRHNSLKVKQKVSRPKSLLIEDTLSRVDSVRSDERYLQRSIRV